MAALTFVGDFQWTIFQLGNAFENFLLETLETIRKRFDVNCIKRNTDWVAHYFHFINRPHFQMICNFLCSDCETLFKIYR